MAQRRMISPDIVDSDAFLDMPGTSQLLYFHLATRADDDGFVSPKKVIRMVGASGDDLKILLAKRFLLTFDSGVVVVKHWLIHNLIRKDRYKPTRYLDEKQLLRIKENGAYTELATTGIQNGNQMAPQVRLGQVRLGQTDILSAPKQADHTDFDTFWQAYPKKELKKKAQAIWQRKRLDDHLPVILVFIQKAALTERWVNGFIKQPPAFLNGECWNDDLAAYGPPVNNPLIFKR